MGLNVLRDKTSEELRAEREESRLRRKREFITNYVLNRASANTGGLDPERAAERASRTFDFIESLND